MTSGGGLTKFLYVEEHVHLLQHYYSLSSSELQMQTHASIFSKRESSNFAHRIRPPSSRQRFLYDICQILRIPLDKRIGMYLTRSHFIHSFILSQLICTVKQLKLDNQMSRIFLEECMQRS